MKAKELDTMVNAMRTKYIKFNSRGEVTNSIYNLCKGLNAIGRNELADMLEKLYMEIEDIDTDELVKLGTFLNK